ncbi:hypothetical protein QR009_24575, partial [Salmonella enterica]|nr:hypothetical protein [Salmonella enterica]
SAKEFIGGRSKMREDQSTYAESVKKLGLERGIEGSRAQDPVFLLIQRRCSDLHASLTARQ